MEDVQTAAKPLEDVGIAVIPVAIGDDADVRELGNLTPDKENVIQPPDGTTPDELAKMIMEKIHTGTIDLLYSSLLCYYFRSNRKTNTSPQSFNMTRAWSQIQLTS